MKDKKFIFINQIFGNMEIDKINFMVTILLFFGRCRY